MNDKTLLLLAVRANPAEDTPRLMLADWFEENGDDARAAFMRLQIQEPKSRKIAELYHANWKRWVPEPFHGKTDCEFERGLIKGLYCNCLPFIEHAGELFAEGCVLSVNLVDRKPLYTPHNDLKYCWHGPISWPQKHNTWIDDAYYLPPCLYRLITPEHSLLSRRYYATRSEALHALRDAALAYGRSELAKLETPIALGS